MKKRNLFLTIFSLVLCLSLIFAVGCNRTTNDNTSTKTSIDVPTKVNTTILYTGTEITLLPDNYDDIKDYCTISGNTATDVGNYTATFTLTDTTKYCWSDKTTTNKTISWTIANTVQLVKPTEDTVSHYYTGKALTYTPTNFEENFETISNNVQYNTGSYDVIVSIKDTEHYTWTDGTTDDLTFTFTILKGQITKPTLNGTLTYSGKIQSYIPNNYEDYKGWIELSGDTTGTTVGTYTMTLTLKDTENTIWADGDTNASFNLTWEIVKKEYDIPTTQVVSYTGEQVTFYPTGMDYDAMEITGNTGTTVGTYTATITLKDTENTCWSDGTTNAKQIEWTIENFSSSYTILEQTTTSLTVKHNTTDKELTITFPENTTFSMNDATNAFTFNYDVSGNETASKKGKVSLAFELSGEFDGSIILNETNTVSTSYSYTVELSLNGVTISDSVNCPLCLLTADDIDVSAVKGTINTINDNRTTALESEEYNAAIYSQADLKLKATGTLNVNSVAYEGIHGKDDVTIQKLTLTVNTYDNAIKGNDSVTIVSGTIKAISTYSNAIKTSNSSLSSQGNQKGTVTIYGGTIDIYSALDGIESVYDVIFTTNPDETTQVDIVMTITTCTYSSYTKRTYTKSSSTSLYSQIMAFGPGGMQPSQPGGGGGFGPSGGGDDGNTNKYEESTKGIKANNEITIERGTITIKAYDDAIHANNDNAIESTGSNGLGNVTISGGTVSVYSMDDGIHADGTLLISGDDTVVNVTNSYEGLEGTFVKLTGGTNSVIATDDGINGTSTSGEAIVISGGTNYVKAGGDGVDSNSNTSYDGILFAGGKTVIIQTSGGNSSIDTNQGYKYTGGYVLALGISNGMSGQESTKCSNFNSIGKTATLSGTTFTASNFVTVKLSSSMSTYAIFLGSNSTSLSTSATYTTYDSNGVCWNI